MIEFLPYEETRKRDWDLFCDESNEAWFWHTSKWIEYTLLYNPLAQAENLSFYVQRNGKIHAVCPLILEENEGVREFSYGKNFIPTPALKNGLSEEEQSDLLKSIFEHIDALAKKHRIQRVQFRFTALDPKSLSSRESHFNYLLKYEFVDISIQTQIIDLSLSLSDLRTGLRHGHKSDITKAEKKLEVRIFNSDTISEEIFNRYKELKIAHGGSTRPTETFNLMLQWIKESNAFLCAAKREEVWVSFAYFFVYKENAYYGSAINAPDVSTLPLAHGIQWKAMQYMKEKGIRFYEIGWQVYSSMLSDFATSKKVNISKFTRGFGGKTYPLFMGEKYYDKGYFLKIWNERIKKVYDSLPGMSDIPGSVGISSEK